MSRGTVTHAASTTESAERASVTATRAGRVNTAPSVSHGDTYSAVHLHTLDRRAQTAEEIHLWADLKGQLWSVNVRIFSAASSIRHRLWYCCRCLPFQYNYLSMASDEEFLMIFTELSGKQLHLAIQFSEITESNAASRIFILIFLFLMFIYIFIYLLNLSVSYNISSKCLSDTVSVGG